MKNNAWAVWAKAWGLPCPDPPGPLDKMTLVSTLEGEKSFHKAMVRLPVIIVLPVCNRECQKILMCQHALLGTVN